MLKYGIVASADKSKLKSVGSIATTYAPKMTIC